jgi:hypothetical protein
VAGYTQPLTGGTHGHAGSHASVRGPLLPLAGAWRWWFAGGERTVPVVLPRQGTSYGALRTRTDVGNTHGAAPLPNGCRSNDGDELARRAPASSYGILLRDTNRPTESTGRESSSPSTRALARRGRRRSETAVRLLDARRPEWRKTRTAVTI